MIRIWTFQPGYLKYKIIEAEEFRKAIISHYIGIFEYNIFFTVIYKWNLLFHNHQIAKTIHYAIVMVTIGKVNKLIFMGLWLFEWLNFSFSSTIIRVLNLVALSHNQNMLLINRQLISAAASSFSSSRGSNIQRIFLETRRR